MLKDLANANIWDWDIFDYAFIWYKILDPFDSSDTLSLCLIVILLLFSMYDVLLWVDQGIFHLLHWKIFKSASYWISCSDDMAIFIWCLGLHMMLGYCLLLIAHCSLFIACCLLKVKGKWLSTWHSCLLDCIPLVRSFQSLTFNFFLG